ncbi:uncharacterized protein ACIGJ3_002796 [Trichechus inunguis]
MEPKSAVQTTKTWSGLGRCRHFFWLGVVFDMVGTVVLFIGVFADLVFYDLLLYLGSIIIFLSLLWWIFWYTGNIEMPPEESLIFRRPFHQSSSAILEALRQSVGHRFSITIGNMSNSLLRIRRFRRTLAIQRAASLNKTVVGQLEKQPGKEDEDKNINESVKESGDAQVVWKEQLSTLPESV